MDRRRLTGEIAYRKQDGTRTGRELFSISVHGDGSRTLRAQCEMDDHRVVRDCLLVLDAGWQPLEAFVRVVAGDRATGSGYFTFWGPQVRARTRSRYGAEEKIETTLSAPARFFGTHSLINDGWLACLANSLGAGDSQTLIGLPSCSLAADGGTPPSLAFTAATLGYCGTERIDCEAGRFDTQHFTIAYGDYPPIDAWVTGSDMILVRMRWSYLQGIYELVRLDHCEM